MCVCGSGVWCVSVRARHTMHRTRQTPPLVYTPQRSHHKDHAPHTTPTAPQREPGVRWTPELSDRTLAWASMRSLGGSCTTQRQHQLSRVLLVTKNSLRRRRSAAMGAHPPPVRMRARPFPPASPKAPRHNGGAPKHEFHSPLPTSSESVSGRLSTAHCHFRNGRPDQAGVADPRQAMSQRSGVR